MLKLDVGRCLNGLEGLQVGDSGKRTFIDYAFLYKTGLPTLPPKAFIIKASDDEEISFSLTSDFKRED